MSWAKSQDRKSIYRNHLQSYILTIKNQKEIKESIPFTIATKIIKYLGINLPKKIKELSTENYKTLMRKIRWHKHMERYPMVLSRKNQYLKMTTLPNAIYRFNAHTIKLPMAFFIELKQKFHNSHGNTKDPEQPKQSWERGMELEESTFLTSDYTTKLQSSRQYGNGIETEI